MNRTEKDWAARFDARPPRGGPTLTAVFITLFFGGGFVIGIEDSTTGFRSFMWGHYVYLAALVGVVLALLYSDWKPGRKRPRISK